jgi:tRNA A-37 threonylcarbamoyl transferase component Bud32/tetratricopeptide (TPR) repeat protein
MQPVNIGVDAPIGEREFRGTERFQLERLLGTGRLGVVYQARDRALNRHVALKTLRDLGRKNAYRFRKEFKALSLLSHKNLVRLGDLHCEAGQWFFTMELVEGRDFLSYVRPEGSLVDEKRLRLALSQLAVALSALHAALKIHQDIKPSNLRISTSDRLVLLDYGLATVAHVPDGLDVRLDDSVPYVAPEQLLHCPLGPAADWYGVGVVLYQALAGRSPFPDSPLETLMAKQREDVVVPPSQIAAGVPSDLDQVCMGLLRRDPHARLSGREVLRRLGVEDAFDLAGSPSAGVSLAPAASFLGRHTELVQIGDAWRASREQAITVLVRGESGIGKSALVRRFAERQAQDGVLVLAGSCHEREAVPYHAFAGVMDALGERLSRLDPVDVALLLPSEAPALALLFPSLRRVPAVARLGQPRQPDPQELRSRAFVALRELFATLAEGRDLLLCIDDLQWADADSLALLVYLLEPPEPPRLLLLATVQTGAGGPGESMLAMLPGEVRPLELHPLADEDAQTLAGSYLGEVVGGNEVAAQVALEAGGHPLFVEELAHHVARLGAGGSGLRLQDVLWARIEGLEPEAKLALELVAVSGRPLRESAVLHATGMIPEALARQVAVLMAGRLVRGHGRSHTLDVYHSRVRQAVLDHLPAGRLAHHHGCLAEALEATGGAAEHPLALVLHYQASGQRERAAALAEKAASQASSTLAFDKAAELYRTALELGQPTGDERRTLLSSLGDALSSAGRGRAAAEAYQAAARGADVADGLELERRAAEQYLRAGRLDEGFAVISRVLSAVGMRLPRSRREALLSVAFRRAQLWLRGLRFQRRQEEQIDRGTLTRIDLCWTASLGLAISDFLSGADFQTRQLLLALDSGEPLRVVRSLAGEAAFSASAGGRGWRRTTKLVRQAETMARELQHPYALGMASLVAGIANLLTGRWRLALEHSEHAEGTLGERCAGVAWELALARTHIHASLAFLGELKELARRVPEALRDAQARGDQYGIVHMGTDDGTLAWLVRDDVDAALRHLATARRESSTKAQLVHLYLIPSAEALIALYQGEAGHAWTCLDKSSRLLERSLLWHVQLLRCRTSSLVATAALSETRALSEGHDRRARLGDAARAAQRLRREGMPYAKALAELIDAGVSAARGHLAQASSRYKNAALLFEGADMALYAASARWRQGELVGGDEGRALVLGAQRVFTGQSVQDPPRILAVLAPALSA